MGTQALPLTPTRDLFADLASVPPREKELVNEEIVGITFLIEHPQVSPADKSVLMDILADRKASLQASLVAANSFVHSRIQLEVHHQLRLRIDFESQEQVVEQWVPALGYWCTSARFPGVASGDFIIAELKKSDPRFRTPDEQFTENKEQAGKQRMANDAAGSERVLQAVDNLGREGIRQFLEVERAIKSGETVIAHGGDEKMLEEFHAQTVRAAAAGEREAQVVLERGQHDNKMCLNPGNNPVHGR